MPDDTLTLLKQRFHEVTATRNAHEASMAADRAAWDAMRKQQTDLEVAAEPIKVRLREASLVLAEMDKERARLVRALDGKTAL